ncbi:MAG TPA: response regulator transcription factor [Vicinamibacterales bacterium]|nr:response regulator transcription factor [Vicinamibacterales bacterium]
MITIAVVDDHRVVARSLQVYLESFDDMQLAGIASSGEELLERFDEWRPQVVIQDLLLPGGIDGIETTRRLLARHPEARVIALTASVDEARMMGVLRAGASGYVRKDAEPETLLAAVRAVARGRTFIDPAIGHHIMRVTPVADDLTVRERDVLRQIALGKSNREIAESLAIGEETVKTHVRHVLAKLGAENRAQAAVRALARGVVSAEDLAPDM